MVAAVALLLLVAPAVAQEKPKPVSPPKPAPAKTAPLPQAKAAPKDPAPKDTVPRFVGTDTIIKPDGLVVRFYRVNYVDPKVLIKELGNWKSAKAKIEAVGPTQVMAGAAPPIGKVGALPPPVAVQSIIRIEETADNWAILERVLEMRDVPEPQVYVEAKIVEITYGDELRVGIDANIDKPAGDTFLRAAAVSFPNRLDATNASELEFATAEKYLAFRYLLQLAEAGAHAEVRSQPGLMASQGHPARIRVGEREPIVEQKFSGSTLVATTRFEEVGLRLDVQPLFIGRDVVRTRVQMELSRVSEFRVTSTGNNNDVVNPVISTRTSETILTVPDGETVVFSGLVASTTQESTTGIPILKDLPVLGFLFGSTTTQESKTELVFFITLTIQRPWEWRLITPPAEIERLEEERAEDGD